MKKKIYYAYGFVTKSGEFNEIGAAWTKEAAEEEATKIEAETGEKCIIKKMKGE